MTKGETCDDGNTDSFDGCSADCCTEPPGPAGIGKDDQLLAMKCFREALKREIAALTGVLERRRTNLATRVDRAGRQEDRAKAAQDRRECGPLRYALSILGGLQRRFDIETARAAIPVAEYLALTNKVTLVRGWYASRRSELSCGS